MKSSDGAWSMVEGDKNSGNLLERSKRGQQLFEGSSEGQHFVHQLSQELPLKIRCSTIATGHIQHQFLCAPPTALVYHNMR